MRTSTQAIRWNPQWFVFASSSPGGPPVAAVKRPLVRLVSLVSFVARRCGWRVPCVRRSGTAFFRPPAAAPAVLGRQTRPSDPGAPGNRSGGAAPYGDATPPPRSSTPYRERVGLSTSPESCRDRREPHRSQQSHLSTAPAAAPLDRK